jgi:hypothetical protein
MSLPCLSEYISLYRRGKVGPLRYEFSGVPIAACRMCDKLRQEDGTPCQSCGAYQHCIPNHQDVGSRIVEAQLSAAAVTTRAGVRRPINPRRRILNGGSR